MNLELLNDKQREAIDIINGPLLILAGAGSGKTKVLTTKVAYLILKVNSNSVNPCLLQLLKTIFLSYTQSLMIKLKRLTTHLVS